ncbi:di/tricarboxylate transporter [Neobacillus niacini]|uniref:hypothetical protein n=1 Tax=Neobacillus niacini TaxID=86668 RepID=UPI0027856BB0|nr:hypothetical protein [Neobacillus niacini]MDQ1002646.1 di/tricarboxylate transporter [Neobacillus niacini]
MSLELIAIIVLLIMFITGSVISVNIGILGFVAAFGVGSLINGLSVEEIYNVFPVDMFILLAGVTYLFAIAQNNGTLDLIISGGIRLVKGKVVLLPGVLFMVCTLLTSVGVSAISVAPILFPIALRLAFQYQINPILMSLFISTGMYAGSFSPLNLFGLVVSGVMKSEGITHSPVLLLVNCFIFYLLISMIIFIFFGGIRSLNNSPHLLLASTNEYSSKITYDKDINELTPFKGATLIGIGLLVTMNLVFDINMGFGAFTVGLVLALMAPKEQVNVLKQMPW